MKRRLYRLAAVITLLAFLISVQAAYQDRIPQRVVYAATITMQPAQETQEAELQESVEGVEATEEAEGAEETEGIGEADGTEAAENAEAAESTEEAEGTGEAEITEEAESAEEVEGAKDTEDVPSTEDKVSESIASSGNIQEPQLPTMEETALLPVYDNLYTIKNSYTPVQPQNTIAENMQDEFNSFGKEMADGVVDAVDGEIQDQFFEAIQKTAKEMSKDYYNQAYIDLKKGSALLQEAYSDRSSYKYFLNDDFMTATNQKYVEAMDILQDGTVKTFKSDVAGMVDAGLEVYSKVGDVISVAGDLITIYEDGKDLVTGNLKNEHSSWRAVEEVLLVTDVGLAAVSIGATLGLITLGPAAGVALAVGSVVVGVSAAFVHSDAFASYMNSTDGSFRSFLEGLFPWMKTPDGVNCYKPNIYIYDKDGRRIQVIFTEPELILIAIPEYEAGWTVDASADGTLLTEQGEEYDFLFYESQTVKGMFDTESGFRIDAGDRQARWESILAEYGFNEEEIADFILFWDVKLEADKDYIMYPQYTETVNEAMPIIVAPEPENMVRIWFVFEEYKGQEYLEEQIEPFSRDGYTVVEWGGMIF